MPNPLSPSYIIVASVAFGPFEWGFLLLQFIVAGMGVYFAFKRSDSNALRKQLVSKLGMALLIVGGIGIVVGGLRLGNVTAFAQPFWWYLVLVAEIAVAGYAAYYARVVYPSQLRNSATSRGKVASSNKRQVASLSTTNNGTGEHHTHDEREETGQPQRSRRDARRERKRRKK
jgi:hypothetical protein